MQLTSQDFACGIEPLQDKWLLGGIILFLLLYGILSIRYAAAYLGLASQVEKLLLGLIIFCSANIKSTPFLHWHLQYLIIPPQNTCLAYFQIPLYLFFLSILLFRISNTPKRIILEYFFKSAKNNIFIWVTPLFAISSVLWSNTPSIAFRGGLVLLFVNFLGLYASIFYNQIGLSAFFRYVGIVIVLMSFVLGETGSDGSLVGILFSKNSLGSISAFTAVLWLINFLYNPRERLFSSLPLLLSILAVFASQSGGGLFTLLSLISVLILLLIMKNFKFKYLIPSYIGLILSIAFCGYLLIANLESLLQLIGKDLTFTGRVPLWQEVWNAVLQRPLLGYGSHSFWQPWRDVENPAAQLISGYWGWEPPHSHLGFLDVWVDLGLVGFVIFILSLFVSLGLAFSQFRKDVEIGAISILCLSYVILANLSESRLVQPSFSWFIFCFMSVSLSISAGYTLQKGIKNTEKMSSWKHQLINIDYS